MKPSNLFGGFVFYCYICISKNKYIIYENKITI